MVSIIWQFSRYTKNQILHIDIAIKKTTGKPLRSVVCYRYCQQRNIPHNEAFLSWYFCHLVTAIIFKIDFPLIYGATSNCSSFHMGISNKFKCISWPQPSIFSYFKLHRLKLHPRLFKPEAGCLVCRLWQLMLCYFIYEPNSYGIQYYTFQKINI